MFVVLIKPEKLSHVRSEIVASLKCLGLQAVRNSCQKQGANGLKASHVLNGVASNDASENPS